MIDRDEDTFELMDAYEEQALDFEMTVHINEDNNEECEGKQKVSIEGRAGP